jgi:hypothetical protein
MQSPRRPNTQPRIAPPSQPQPRAKLLSLFVLLLGLSCIIGALIMAFALRTMGERVGSAIDAANPANLFKTALPAATPTLIARPSAIHQIRAIADLSTVSSYMSTVVEAQKARVGNVIVERLLLVACGRVKAGIDLSKLREDDVKVSPDGKTVTVTLPQAEFQDIYLIDDSSQPCTTRVYDRTNLVVLSPTLELEGQARERAVQSLREMAVQTGMLRDANRNARVIIERVLLAAGFEKVVFVEK